MLLRLTESRWGENGGYGREKMHMALGFILDILISTVSAGA